MRGGALVGLVYRVGARLVGPGQDLFPGYPPRTVSVCGPLEFGHGFPPMLRGVREGGGDCLAWLVDRVVARSNLVARSPPWGRGVRRKVCKGFSPGEVGVPGYLQFFFQGYPYAGRKLY